MLPSGDDSSSESVTWRTCSSPLQNVLKTQQQPRKKKNLCFQAKLPRWDAVISLPKNKQVLIASCVEERQILVCRENFTSGTEKDNQKSI